MVHLKSSKGKKAAGAAAAALVTDGMKVGIGTGSTASHFISALITRVKEGLQISAIATSQESSDMAKAGGIPLLNPAQVDHLDIAIDGADEVDPQKRLIKGGGGALLREKIVASMANEMVVIVDHTKLVDKLGTFGLPIEVLPFGIQHTLEQLGPNAQLRNGFVTDNGNFIVDLAFDDLLEDPEEIDSHLKTIPGVIETGFFFDLAGRLLVGQPDGSVEVL